MFSKTAYIHVGGIGNLRSAKAFGRQHSNPNKSSKHGIESTEWSTITIKSYRYITKINTKNKVLLAFFRSKKNILNSAYNNPSLDEITLKLISDTFLSHLEQPLSERYMNKFSSILHNPISILENDHLQHMFCRR